MRYKSFILAFSTQKLLEFILLTGCMAVQLYLGSRMPDPAAWGVGGEARYGIGDALKEGFGIALAFFLFTLYPIGTFVMVALGRNFLGEDAPKLVPWLSAVVSVLYVLYWVGSLNFDFSLPYWTVTAIMATFIVCSSAILYPPFSAKEPMGRRAE